MDRSTTSPTPRSPKPVMPYFDINPHKARPRWQAYTGLIVLLAVTAAVVAAALTRV